MRKINVGVAALVIRDRKFLVSRRKPYIRPETGLPAVGAGKLAMPGGHNEEGEPYYVTAERETLEETGLVVKACRWDGGRYDLHTRFHMEGTQHYLTIYVPVRVIAGEVENKELDKHGPWLWISLAQIHQMACDDVSWLPLGVMNYYRNQLGL
jgi:8-oxo-dGTP pyrophosphatase MutT (NUDIX family)